MPLGKWNQTNVAIQIFLRMEKGQTSIIAIHDDSINPPYIYCVWMDGKWVGNGGDDQIQEKQQAAAMEQQQHQQQLGIEVKPVEEQQVMEQFPFSGEEQPSSVLQLATLPPHFYPYRLQPTHPNLQDFTLQYPGFGSIGGATATVSSIISSLFLYLFSTPSFLGKKNKNTGPVWLVFLKTVIDNSFRKH